MKRQILCTQLLLLSCLATLHADTGEPRENVEDLINPPSRFQVRDGYNMFLTADFLWWSANTDGLYYAQSRFGAPTDQNPPDDSVDFSGHLQRVKERWRPGVRVGFGGNMPYDEWDIYLNWTWFHCDPKATAKESSDGPLLVLWGRPDLAATNLATHAEAKWDLTINVLDLELGRWFWVGKHLSVRPLIGIRGAWIDQEFRIHYRYATTPQLKSKLKMESDLEGVGARAGIDLRFALLNGWSLYGLATGALLYGHLDCDFHQKENSHRIARTDDGFHRGVSTVQMGLGVQWDTYFCKRRYHVGISAGWEQNIWYGVTQFNHFKTQLQFGNLEQNNGDLTLQGGTLTARFDF